MGNTLYIYAGMLRRVRSLSARTLMFLISLILVASSSIYVWQTAPKVQAVDGAKMLMFWDGASAPSGWSFMTGVDGKFPRGDAPGVVLQTGGSSSQIPTLASTVINTITGGITPNNAVAANTAAAANHTHSLSVPIDVGEPVDNSGVRTFNKPLHRTMKIIQFDGGIPATLPAGAIAMFDASPGIPAGWNMETARNGRMIGVNNTDTSFSTTDGGSDTHKHLVTWPDLAASATAPLGRNGGTPTSDVNIAAHTHAKPAATFTPLATAVPPYVKPLLAKTPNPVAVPTGMIAMFDNNPGGGWAIQSGAEGSTFYQQFFRPAATFDGNSAGGSTHTDPGVTSGQYSVAPAGQNDGPSSTAGTALSSILHTHTMTTTFNPADNTPEYFNVVVAKKELPSLMVFWDGDVAAGSNPIPSGWSRVTSYYQRFPRGEAPSNYGATGGSATHAHTRSGLTLSGPSGGSRVSGLFNDGASLGHTHNLTGVTTSIASGSSLPRYKDLILIKFDGGIPNVIPKGAITIFDDTPGIPPGSVWEQYTPQNDKYIRVNNVATGPVFNGGHVHSVTWGGTLGTGGGTSPACVLFCGSGSNTASTTHTHTVSGTANSETSENDPPNIKPLLAKANAPTSTLSTGLTAMFTGDPGSGWSIQSSAGGKFYKRFLLPQTSYSQPADLSNFCSPGFGCTYHSHTALRTTSNASGSRTDDGANGNTAVANHTHVLTAAMYPSGGDPVASSNPEYFLPPYFNVVIAEKVDFSLEHYRWYEESDAANGNVSDPWSILNTPQSTGITTLPLVNQPPKLGDRLRLRVQILVNNNPLATSAILYKLQYKKSPDGLCSSGTWSDVGAAGSSDPWRFASTHGVTDGVTLTSTVLTGSTVPQSYSNSNPTRANPNPVPAGGYMEYDFDIQHNGADGGAQYSFRVVEDGNILLSEYKNCPILVTMPDTSNQLRHGQFFESSGGTDGFKRGYSWTN